MITKRISLYDVVQEEFETLANNRETHLTILVTPGGLTDERLHKQSLYSVCDQPR